MCFCGKSSLGTHEHPEEQGEDREAVTSPHRVLAALVPYEMDHPTQHELLTLVYKEIAVSRTRLFSSPSVCLPLLAMIMYKSWEAGTA